MSHQVSVSTFAGMVIPFTLAADAAVKKELKVVTDVVNETSYYQVNSIEGCSTVVFATNHPTLQAAVDYYNSINDTNSLELFTAFNLLP
jgi:hypothetical protein